MPPFWGRANDNGCVHECVCCVHRPSLSQISEVTPNVERKSNSSSSRVSVVEIEDYADTSILLKRSCSSSCEYENGSTIRLYLLCQGCFCKYLYSMEATPIANSGQAATLQRNPSHSTLSAAVSLLRRFVQTWRVCVWQHLASI